MARTLKALPFLPEFVNLPAVQSFDCGDAPWEREVAAWIQVGLGGVRVAGGFALAVAATGKSARADQLDPHGRHPEVVLGQARWTAGRAVLRADSRSPDLPGDRAYRAAAAPRPVRGPAQRASDS